MAALLNERMEKVATMKIRLLFDALVVALLAFVLMPASLNAVSFQVGLDPHPVSFFIAPALYSFSDGLIPGIDYMTQYGIGYAPIVKQLLGKDAAETIRGTTALLLAVTWAFYASLYAVSASFLRSRKWAVGVTFFLLFLNFYTVRPFWAPSVWPARFPFLMIFCYLFVRAVLARNAATLALLGTCIAFSLFLNTEVGLCMCLCTALGYLIATRGPLLQRSGELGLAFTSAGLTFFVLTVGCYGWGVLSLNFLRGLLEPLLLYGGLGFGGTVINWSFTYNLLLHIAFPMLIAGSVGLAAWALRNRPLANDQRRDCVFQLIFGLSAICLLGKWLNMSLNALWFSSAHLPVLLGAWWVKQLSEVGASSRWARPGGIAARCALALIAVLFLATCTEPRWDIPYAFRSYWSYPSLLKRLIAGRSFPGWAPYDRNVATGAVRPVRLPAYATQNRDVPAADVHLIRENTALTDRVAILSNHDWAYLVAARRAPKFEFLPSSMCIFASQVERSIDGATLLFVDQSEVVFSAEVNQRVEARLLRDFELAGVGANLVMYRLKTN